jgi:hypothetical protein
MEFDPVELNLTTPNGPVNLRLGERGWGGLLWTAAPPLRRAGERYGIDLQCSCDRVHCKHPYHPGTYTPLPGELAQTVSQVAPQVLQQCYLQQPKVFEDWRRAYLIHEAEQLERHIVAHLEWAKKCQAKLETLRQASPMLTF